MHYWVLLVGLRWPVIGQRVVVSRTSCYSLFLVLSLFVGLRLSPDGWDGSGLGFWDAGVLDVEGVSPQAALAQAAVEA